MCLYYTLLAVLTLVLTFVLMIFPYFFSNFRRLSLLVRSYSSVTPFFKCITAFLFVISNSSAREDKLSVPSVSNYLDGSFWCRWRNWGSRRFRQRVHIFFQTLFFGQEYSDQNFLSFHSLTISLPFIVAIDAFYIVRQFSRWPAGDWRNRWCWWWRWIRYFTVFFFKPFPLPPRYPNHNFQYYHRFW